MSATAIPSAPKMIQSLPPVHWSSYFIEADPADAAVQDAGGLWWMIAAGAGVLVLLAALAMAAARNRKAPLD